MFSFRLDPNYVSVCVVKGGLWDVHCIYVKTRCVPDLVVFDKEKCVHCTIQKPHTWTPFHLYTPRTQCDTKVFCVKTSNVYILTNLNTILVHCVYVNSVRCVSWNKNVQPPTSLYGYIFRFLKTTRDNKYILSLTEPPASHGYSLYIHVSEYKLPLEKHRYLST